MIAAVLYRHRQRWQIWIAFISAIAIHMVAVAIAANRSPDNAFRSFDPPSVDIETDGFVPDEPPPPQLEIPSIPEEPSVTNDDEMFRDESPAPSIRPRKMRPVAPVAPRANAGTSRSTPSNSFKVRALSAPRPEYPYEARRRRATGSGTASLKIDAGSGNVVEVRMSQSTGSPILDNATLSALRRWRFKPGDSTTINVPITFTLNGAVY